MCVSRSQLKGALFTVALIAAGATSVPSWSQTSGTPSLPGGWQLIQSSRRALDSRPADPADALWAREIMQQAHNTQGLPRTLWVDTLRFADGAREYVVSIANIPDPEVCDNGPNDINATRNYAVCPGKLAVIESGRLVRSKPLGPLCTESINVGGVTRGQVGWQNPALEGTRGRYDPATHTIQLVTMQGGKAERVCSKTIQTD